MSNSDEILLVANHLECRADDAYMERDGVRMTPSEVHALADDIKTLVRERDEALRLIPENEDDVETCPHCGWRYMVAWPASFGCMEFGTAEHCPKCGKEIER